MMLSLSREGNRSWRWGGLLLRDLDYLCGSDMLSRRRWGAAAGSCGAGRGGGEGRCGGGGTRGRGGGWGQGLDRRRRLISRGGGRSRLVVVHLEDVLLEVSDPVLLHRQWAVKLHLTEPDADTLKLGIMRNNTNTDLHQQSELHTVTI